MSHIRLFATIGAAPERVFERWSSLDGVRSWWTSDVQGAAEAGREFSLGFGRATRQRIAVVAVEPGRVEWRPVGESAPDWVGTRIVCRFDRFENARPWQSAGTAVRLEHLDWREFTDFAAHCNTTWARLLLGFKRMCEREGVSPERFDPRVG